LSAIAVIHDIIHEHISNCRVILFGSRAGKKFNVASDYDVLVITEDEFPVNEERRFASLIRKYLALLAIDADVIVKSKIEIEYFRDKYGSVVREALKEGIPI
jgi:predicted nucleotidyltransferase